MRRCGKDEATKFLTFFLTLTLGKFRVPEELFNRLKNFFKNASYGKTDNTSRFSISLFHKFIYR